MCRVLQVARAGFYARLQCPMPDARCPIGPTIPGCGNSFAIPMPPAMVSIALVVSLGTSGKPARAAACIVWSGSCSAKESKLCVATKSPVPSQGGPPSSPPTICSASSQSMLLTKSGSPTLPTSGPGGVAIPGGGAGPLRAQGGGLVDESYAGQGAGTGCIADGGVAPQAPATGPGA